MAKKAKTRFVLEVDGTLKETFSILELNDNGLNILEKFEQRYGEDRDSPYVSETRISVHPSPASPGTLIKRHKILIDGTAITNALFIKDSKVNLLAHLCTKACPVFTDRYDCRPRERDQVVTLGRCKSSDACTFVYAILVGNRDRQYLDIRGFSKTRVQFRQFSIAIYSHYLNVPPFHASMTIMQATSPEQINGVASKPPIGDGGPSLTDEELPALLLDYSERAAAQLCIMMSKELPSEQATFLMGWPLWFYPTPESLLTEEAARLIGSA
jgi:hypothetical protein